MAEPANARVTKQTQDAQPIAPLSQRYAKAETSETPDFQKHVVPLLGRLGCNGRACHGSFQGRGGFQLSLFGYDFQGDHKALLDEAAGRVDTDDIDESLMLAKPLDADIHEGGKRFDKNSWQHNVLRQWIESGAKFDDEVQSLVRLEVTPKEILFLGEEKEVQLKVIAHWDDGTAENVTELCRFSSNDDSIAEIDDVGFIKSGERGDTHVVVYYDSAVEPIPVMRPIGAELQNSTKPNQVIDQLVQAKLDKLGIVPSGQCTDAEFIRRASLDVTGVLPTANQVREFLADNAPDKREQLVEQLLDSPGYAAWWATRFSDWTGNSEEQLNNVLPIRNVASRLWHEWLRKRINENVAYDDIVEGIVTAGTREPGESYTDFCKTMTKACEPGNESLFAEREGLPMFWGRRNFQKPEDRAIGFAYTFLGVRVECAQCHKHPFDQWSKDDFEQFAKLFSSIRMNQKSILNESRKERDKLQAAIVGERTLKGGELRKAIYKAAQEGKTVPFGELTVNTSAGDRARKAAAMAKKKGRKPPKAVIPQGKILGDSVVKLDTDPRGELMEWLRSENNPYFAKAVVNRVWSNYFGIGIVDPTDDMNLANPPSNAPLLDHIATEFVNHDFDLKWLHRKIVNSETYQRSAATNETNVMDRVNFSRHMPRRLPAEVVYDSVVLATGSDEHANKIRGEVDSMAIAEGKPRQRNKQDFALEVFGQSIRESNCDCDRSNSPSLLQSIYLRNDLDMHKRLSDKDGWVTQACEALGVDGPSAKGNPKAKLNLRRAEERRAQFVKRVIKFQKLTDQRQKKSKPQLQKEYKKLVQQMNQNGYLVPSMSKLLARPQSWASLKPKQKTKPATVTMASLVEEAYLRTLSRFPDEEETEISITFIEESESPASGVQSLVWALVNTKEFIITH